MNYSESCVCCDGLDFAMAIVFRSGRFAAVNSCRRTRPFRCSWEAEAPFSSLSAHVCRHELGGVVPTGGLSTKKGDCHVHASHFPALPNLSGSAELATVGTAFGRGAARCIDGPTTDHLPETRAREPYRHLFCCTRLDIDV